MNRITIDFETRSRADLSKIGAWLYSIHPSTEPIMLTWSDGFIYENQWDRWGSTSVRPDELFRLLSDGETVVEAHNAFFEWCIWHNICVPRYDWPAIEWSRWRCSRSKVAACSLPKSLGPAGKILHLDTVKDEAEGKRAMMKLSKPKKDGTWHEDKADIEVTLLYNRTDVRAEEHLSNALPDLSPAELEIWRMTEEINRRGIMVDVEGCRRAVAMADEYATRLTAEFSKITGLDTAGQRAKFLVWLEGRGHKLEDTQAPTITKFIANTTDQEARHAASIVRDLGRSSVKKYMACLKMAAPDGRARGTIQYHAAHTGRWSGQGLQPQNFKRECPWNMDEAWRAIHRYDLDTIELIYGNPQKFLADVTRGALVAAPGKIFMAGDYAQIEPRVLFWQAGERRGLASFARGDDVYLEMASLIFNKKLNKKDHSEERFLGKHAVLALGYGAGYIKFLVHCRDLGAPRFGKDRVKSLVPAGQLNAIIQWIVEKNWKNVIRKMPEATKDDVWDLALCKYIVDKYRKRHKETVVQYWRDVENAVRRAINNRNKPQPPIGKVTYTCGKHFLNCRLPSGRMMRYLYPKLVYDKNERRNSDIDDDDDYLDDYYAEHGEIFYTTPEGYRIGTYGGKLVENLTQAISRDIMAERMLALRETDTYSDIVMTVHDEVICEVDKNAGSLQEFLDILAVVPDWCPEVPIKVEGWEGQRYHKE